jgi:hypothetical protein
MGAYSKIDLGFRPGAGDGCHPARLPRFPGLLRSTLTRVGLGEIGPTTGVRRA